MEELELRGEPPLSGKACVLTAAPMPAPGPQASLLTFRWEHLAVEADGALGFSRPGESPGRCDPHLQAAACTPTPTLPGLPTQPHLQPDSPRLRLGDHKTHKL